MKTSKRYLSRDREKKKKVFSRFSVIIILENMKQNENKAPIL